MPKIADRIVVDYAHRRLFIEGQEFPWTIAEEGCRVSASDENIATVTVTLYARQVEAICNPSPEALD